MRWGGGWVAGSTAVNNGAWHQITYTNLAGTKTIYVDGVVSALSQNQFFNADTGSTIRIGFAPGGESDGEITTNGSLSGIKIFSSALSASQVAQLYSGGRMTSVLPTTTDVSIAAGAVLDVNGVSQTIRSLSGPAGSAVKLGNGGQLTVSSSVSTSFAGSISGAGGAGLTKGGSGMLTLSGDNTYCGATTITGGILRLVNPGTVTPATPVASYSFSHVSGITVINDGSGGSAMNGTFNLNGGTGSINTSGGPAAGMGALALNGSNTTVDVNSGITDLSSGSNWTVSAWIKSTQAGATILNKGDGANWSSGFSTFYLGNGNNAGSGGLPDAVRWGGGWLSGSTPVADGNWHLLTYTDTAGTKTIYVDGVADTLSQYQFLSADTGSKVRIGFAPTSIDGELPTNGSLSGINIYNTALSAAQVAALYGAVAGSPLPSSTNVTVSAGATLDINGTVQTITSLSGPAGSAVTLGAGQLTINSATSTEFAGTISGTGGSLIKQGAATLTLSGANNYNGPIVVSGGTLRLNVAGGSPTIASGVIATVGSGATLELAGSVSALGTAGGNRARVVNNSLGAAGQQAGLVVSGVNQVVGGIDGLGSTQVDAGGKLTADHIIQSALVIGGAAGNPALVTIDPSNANGLPLVEGQMLPGALESNTSLASDIDSTSLIELGANNASNSVDPAIAQVGSSPVGEQSAVPEPTSVLLLILGGLATLPFARQRIRRSSRD